MRRRSFLALMVTAMLLTSCGTKGERQVEQMTDVLVRTAASTQGQSALVAAGVQVTSPLTCQTTPQGDQFQVSCTGTTVEGQPVSVTGTAQSLVGGTAVKGSFVGTANGRQVFTSDCLGC